MPHQCRCFTKSRKGDRQPEGVIDFFKMAMWQLKKMLFVSPPTVYLKLTFVTYEDIIFPIFGRCRSESISQIFEIKWNIFCESSFCINLFFLQVFGYTSFGTKRFWFIGMLIVANWYEHQADNNQCCAQPPQSCCFFIENQTANRRLKYVTQKR